MFILKTLFLLLSGALFRRSLGLRTSVGLSDQLDSDQLDKEAVEDCVVRPKTNQIGNWRSKHNQLLRKRQLVNRTVLVQVKIFPAQKGTGPSVQVVQKRGNQFLGTGIRTKSGASVR